MRERCREPTGSPLAEIGIDDAPENFARARIEIGQGACLGAGLGEGGRHRLTMAGGTRTRKGSRAARGRKGAEVWTGA